MFPENVPTAQKPSVKAHSYILSLLVSNSCWEARIGHALIGYTTKTIPDVLPSVCMTMCEEETEFLCLSADYRSTDRECYLSSESAKTQPNSFSTHPENIYYERVLGCYK